MHSPAPGFKNRHIFIVLAVSWVVRCAFVWLMPEQVRSADIYSWEVVAQTLYGGGNPYKETTVLNWPPLWMLLIYLMSKVTVATNIPLMQVLRVFLALVESCVIIALFRLVRRIAPQARAFVPILLGIALNPVAFLLICQHGNFDVLVGLWMLLFVGELISYYKTEKPEDWLAACLFLGLGILTKTVPLVLCPMLAGGWRRLTWKTRAIGSAFLLGPVTLGMSVIYVLAPGDVTAKVLGYRSTSRWFGVSGLLHLSGADGLIGVTDKLFYLLLVVAAVLMAYAFWKRDRVEPRGIVLCAVIFLAGVPCLGPGYGPQYLYWSLPLLLASWFLCAGWWRWLVAVFGAVAALTFLVEYGILPSHGMYFVFLIRDLHPLSAGQAQVMVDLLNWCGTPTGQTLMRLPLFLAFLVLIGAGTRLLVRNLCAASLADEPAGRDSRDAHGTPTPN